MPPLRSRISEIAADTIAQEILKAASPTSSAVMSTGSRIASLKVPSLQGTDPRQVIRGMSTASADSARRNILFHTNLFSLRNISR